MFVAIVRGERNNCFLLSCMIFFRYKNSFGVKVFSISSEAR